MCSNSFSSVPTAKNSQVIATLEDICKIYGSGENIVHALDHVSLEIRAGEFTAITGPSGCGKSTLLHVLAGLDSATSGRIIVDGIEVNSLKDATEFRRDKIGFIFQAFNLIPTMSARQNIMLPMRLAKRKIDTAWMDSVVNMLGLANRLDHTPGQLSGGQIQRVAIARALLSRPALIVADEPTGNLDSRASNNVLEILSNAVHEVGQTVVMVTHDRHAAALADRVIALNDGRIVADIINPSESKLLEVM